MARAVDVEDDVEMAIARTVRRNENDARAIAFHGARVRLCLRAHCSDEINARLNRRARRRRRRGDATTGPRSIQREPVNAYVCTLAVDDLDDAMKAGVAAGGSVALPCMPIPGVGHVGCLNDTEGDIFGLSSGRS
jgi:predicted enzyme related to lactoylglutathione lyase